MTGRTVEISSRAHIYLRHRQFMLDRKELAETAIPLEDLAHVITTNPEITYTHAVLAAMMEAKTALVICGQNHMPAGILLPYAANQMSGEKLRGQLACPKPLVKRLWQSIVAAKLRRQADLLHRVCGGDFGLTVMARRVRSGDPDNLEAQGAQRYWPELLGREFRRDRDAQDANRLLNYGYAILRAATARALVGAGLMPAIGLFHGNRGDAFPLASDLMEPFRPFIDGVVWELRASDAASGPMDTEVKRHLLATLNLGVRIGGQIVPLSMALERMSASLAESFGQGRNLLRLPEGAAGLPSSPEDLDAETATAT